MTQPTISDFSTTAGSNTDFNTVGILGTNLLSTADDASRMLAAMLAGYSKDLAGIGQTVGGSANAITLTVAQPWAALANGLILAFKNTGGPNTTAVTLAVTNSLTVALGTKAIRLQGDSALTGGEMVVNGIYLARYDTTYNAAAGAWVLLNPANAGAAVALGTVIDALTAKATPVDADEMPISDSAASNVGKKVTLTNFWVNYLKPKAQGSGQTLISFRPAQNEPPSTNYATFSTRNAHPILTFPDAVVYVAQFTGILPVNYNGGGLTVDIIWMCSTTSTLKMCYSATIEFMDVGTTDFDSDSYGTQVIDTTGVAANATSGIASKTTIALTAGAQMDSLTAGQAFRLKITRETGQANDTNAGDGQILIVHVKET